MEYPAIFPCSQASSVVQSQLANHIMLAVRHIDSALLTALSAKLSWYGAAVACNAALVVSRNHLIIFYYRNQY